MIGSTRQPLLLDREQPTCPFNDAIELTVLVETNVQQALTKSEGKVVY